MSTPFMSFPDARPAIRSAVRLVRLGASDAARDTDDLKALRALVLVNEPMYPGIARWFTEKVVPGLAAGQRVAYVGYDGSAPIASAVLKYGANAKLCHLRIAEAYRDQSLGTVLFARMAALAAYPASAIHFTLPEGLWTERRGFFEQFGFTTVVKAAEQYRSGETELLAFAPAAVVLARARRLLEERSNGGILRGSSCDPGRSICHAQS